MLQIWIENDNMLGLYYFRENVFELLTKSQQMASIFV